MVVKILLIKLIHSRILILLFQIAHTVMDQIYKLERIISVIEAS